MQNIKTGMRNQTATQVGGEWKFTARMNIHMNNTITFRIPKSVLEFDKNAAIKIFNLDNLNLIFLINAQ